MRETDDFKKWIRNLRDRSAVGIVNLRLKKLSLGNPGEVEPVGEGVSELKIHYGPGYRVYYKVFDSGTVVLLGGDKADQRSDIARAKHLARSIERELAETSKNAR